MQIAADSTLSVIQLDVQPLHGQPHHVVERSFDTLDPDIADPLLNAVRASLVIGSVRVDIMADFLVGQRPEKNVGRRGKRNRAVGRADRHAGDDPVPAARKRTQHRDRDTAVGGLAENTIVDGDDRIGRHLPIFDVITLAATGSEYDGGGVITNEETKEKLSVGGCYPVASILDPEYTFTVPANQTAAGISDILSHTFEQYIVRDGNMLSDGFCESMLRTVTHFGPIAVKDPTNYEARAEILAASSFGCCGLLSLGRTPSPWPCHGMEHELSAWYDITHGVGLAILTPNWMRWCLETDPTTVTRFAQYGVNVWKLNSRHDPMENAKDAIANTRKFFDSIGIPNTLGALGIDDTHFGEMADHIQARWGDLGKAFVPMDRDAILTVLRMSL